MPRLQFLRSLLLTSPTCRLFVLPNNQIPPPPGSSSGRFCEAKEGLPTTDLPDRHVGHDVANKSPLVNRDWVRTLPDSIGGLAEPLAH